MSGMTLDRKQAVKNLNGLQHPTLQGFAQAIGVLMAPEADNDYSALSKAICAASLAIDNAHDAHRTMEMDEVQDELVKALANILLACSLAGAKASAALKAYLLGVGEGER